MKVDYSQTGEQCKLPRHSSVQQESMSWSHLYFTASHFLVAGFCWCRAFRIEQSDVWEHPKSGIELIKFIHGGKISRICLLPEVVFYVVGDYKCVNSASTFLQELKKEMKKGTYPKFHKQEMKAITLSYFGVVCQCERTMLAGALLFHAHMYIDKGHTAAASVLWMTSTHYKQKFENMPCPHKFFYARTTFHVASAKPIWLR